MICTDQIWYMCHSIEFYLASFKPWESSFDKLVEYLIRIEFLNFF
jgi:hypothetical protein